MRKLFVTSPRLISGAAAVALAATAFAVIPAVTAPPVSAQVQVMDVSALAQRLLPAVVNISSRLVQTSQTEPPAGRKGPNGQRQRPETFRGDPRGPGGPFGPGGPGGRGGPGSRGSIGSGFIIDSSGLIVTNNHVIDGANEVTVTLQDGTELAATVVGTDALVDLALLQVDVAQPLPFVEWGNSNAAQVGHPVIAIGTPFGLGGTVTTGIVSAVERDIRSGPFDSFIQTDAAINSGNSGGPLFDIDGQVIGINTAIFSRTGGNVGIGFAIPQSIAEDVIEQLRSSGTVRRGQLGVQISPVTPEAATEAGLDEPSGVMVGQVTSGSPAEAAGMLEGDIIVTYAGEPVTGTDALVRSVVATEIGSSVEVGLLRLGEEITVSVIVGERT